MGEEIKKLTPAGRIQRPAYNLVARWIKAAWDHVDPNLIKRSFKCCSVSTAQDGSEEDILFNYNWVADPERQNEGGNHIYFNNSSENNDAVDLTQGNNSDDYSSSDERSEYDSDGKNNDSEDENKHENENYNIREEDEDNWNEGKVKKFFFRKKN